MYSNQSFQPTTSIKSMRSRNNNSCNTNSKKTAIEMIAPPLQQALQLEQHDAASVPLLIANTYRCNSNISN